jgi:ribose-phosphate pyrophosphokinase
LFVCRDVKEATVIIIDDIVDTAGTLSTLARQMSREGASKVYLCASHGLFSSNCMDLIDLSQVDKVIVTDSVQLPKKSSSKIVQVSVAAGLATIIEAELRHMSETNTASSLDNEEYALD